MREQEAGADRQHDQAHGKVDEQLAARQVHEDLLGGGGRADCAAAPSRPHPATQGNAKMRIALDHACGIATQG